MNKINRLIKVWQFLIIFSLILMIGTVYGISFGGLSSNYWLSHQVNFDNAYVVDPTNGTITDALKVSDDVLLLPGTYTGEGNTNINITGNKQIRATDPETVIIDGERKTKLFNVKENSSLNLTNLILTGGNDSAGNGGAIFSNGALNIEGSTIQNNVANIGGSIYIDGNNTFSFVNSKIINNYALMGAAVYITQCNGIIKNTTFENNGNLDPNLYVYASGLLINGTSNINVTNSIFKDNKGTMGSGLTIIGSLYDIEVENTKVNINNTTFCENKGITSGAGLLCICADVFIENSKFYNNEINE